MTRNGCRRQKELTKLELYRSGRFQCKSDCTCPLPDVIKGMEEKLKPRLSDSKASSKEREIITEFFKVNTKVVGVRKNAIAFTKA